MTRSRGILEIGSGAAVGSLVGLIAGLSISPVASIILGALSTGLLILLGLQGSKGNDNSENHPLRVLGFGLFCSIALVGGILLRTHQMLSPSLDKQRQRLADVGVFTPEEIDQILLSTNYGLHPPTVQVSADNAMPQHDAQKGSRDTHIISKVANETVATADLASGGFLRAGSAGFCQVVRREQFQDVRAYVDELKRADSKAAAVIESVPPTYQDSLSKSFSRYLCP